MSTWTDVYNRFRPDVLAFLQRRCWGRPELAEDLCQETFTRAMGATVEMDNLRRVRAYLLRTANNLLISHIRRSGRVTSEGELGAENLVEGHEDTRSGDPHSATVLSQLQGKVKELVAELPPDQRVAFERGVIDKMPYSEIAEEQEWTVAKVKICIYRARKHLIAGLRDYR